MILVLSRSIAGAGCFLPGKELQCIGQGSGSVCISVNLGGDRSSMDTEQIAVGGDILAIIIRHDFSKPGVHFLTPSDFSQQLGYLRHPAGKLIQPHVHRLVERAVNLTQEVLFIRRGRIRVDFYTNQREYVESRILEAGDIVLLASAGHGFEVLEEVEMYEVKQGPYLEQDDKVRFDGIPSDKAKIKGSEDS
jgi:mannose-6-phosphate isomerase-like protein (cupin superfamily)